MLVTASNMHEYFREALRAALQVNSVPLTDEAKAYLVYLLAEFARTENAYAGINQGDQPSLALLLSRAQESQPEEALRIYKHLGDSALYLLGFFAERMSQQAVSSSYYVSMGETAYSSASSLIRAQTFTAAALYAELADRFFELVKLLNTMSLYGESQRPEGRADPDHLLGLMERYRKTGNPQLLGLLKSHGLIS